MNANPKMKVNYKIGDFLTCKRSMNNKSKRLKYFFIKGEEYKIAQITHEGFPSQMIYLINAKGKWQGFYVYDNEYCSRDKKLSRFFLDLKGMRKKKLKKLKELFE